jgi:hypothetical protein
MKRLFIILAIMLMANTCSAAWVDVVHEPDFKFSVKQESIQHYVSKAGNYATSGIYNFYDYRTNGETSHVIAINDETYTYRISRSCTWKNSVLVECRDRNDIYQAEPKTNAWVIMDYMVRYNRRASARDEI